MKKYWFAGIFGAFALTAVGFGVWLNSEPIHRAKGSWLHLVGPSGGFGAADLVPLISPDPTSPHELTLTARLRNDGGATSAAGYLGMLGSYYGKNAGDDCEGYVNINQHFAPVPAGTEVSVSARISDQNGSCGCVQGACNGGVSLFVVSGLLTWYTGDEYRVNWSLDGQNIVDIVRSAEVDPGR